MSTDISTTPEPKRKSKIYVSPSQLDTFLSCQRKWAFEKIDGIRGPQNHSAAAGDRAHKVLEDWLQFGKPTYEATTFKVMNWKKREEVSYDIASIVTPAVPFLPAPGPHNKVEGSFSFDLFRGRLDLEGIGEVQGHHIPIVYDHKTTGDFKWAKTPETLSTDPQAMLYAKKALTENPDAPGVILQWTYMKTTRPYGAKPVRLMVYREHVETMYQHFRQIAEYMIWAREQKNENLAITAHSFPVNRGTCEAYGGCPHVRYCTVTQEERDQMSQQIYGAQPPSNAGFAAVVSSFGQPQPAPVPTPGQPGPVPGFPVPGPAPVPAPMPSAVVSSPWVQAQPGWEYNTITNEYRQVPQLNPPEGQGLAPVPSPVVAAPSAVEAVDESKIGDAFDNYSKAQLVAFATQNGIEVPPRKQEKGLRIHVREQWALMQGRQAQAISPAPVPAPAPVVVPGPVPAPVAVPDPVPAAPEPARKYPMDLAAMVPLMAASIARGEAFDDELERARATYARLEAMMRVLDSKR